MAISTARGALCLLAVPVFTNTLGEKYPTSQMEACYEAGPGTGMQAAEARHACSVQLGPQWAQHERLSAVSRFDSPLAATLGPLYAAQDAAGSVMYNDEPPASHGSNISFNLAHAKGDMCAAD